MAVKKAAKKTAKKAAKKTYLSAKKTTFPKLRGRLTVEALAAVMAENHAKTEAAIERLSENHAKTEAKMAKSREETDARMAKSREETDARMAESREKMEAAIGAAIGSLAEQGKKMDAAVEKMASEVRELSRNLSHVGKDLGELMEFIVIPKIRLAMNATGKHSFDRMVAGRKYRVFDELGEKKPFTEVDVLLYSDAEVMAVETKSHLTTRYVRDHMERLEKLRRHEDLVGVKDKKLIGAVVGAIVDKGVKKFALERGLCVVTIREEEEKLDVAEPETCRSW